MRRTIVAVVAALVMAATAGAALANGGFGLGGFFGLGPTSRTALLNDVASRLKVTPTALRTAIEDAEKAQIDQQVKDGVLTKAEGDAIKERIDSGRVGIMAGGPADLSPGELGILSSAADYLGLSSSDLRNQLDQGNSLSDVAKAKSKDVAGLKTAIVNGATKALATAVSSGDLTDTQRDTILAQVKNNIDDLVTQKLGSFGLRGHGRLGALGLGLGLGLGLRR